jgi:hypothetical protein
LLSLGGHSKQTGDELRLTWAISCVHALHLPFPDHVHHLVSLQCSPPGLKRKNLNSCVADKCPLIEPDHSQLSIARQCDLLEVARSSYYYQPMGESAQNLLLMRLLDEQYTRTPFTALAA